MDVNVADEDSRYMREFVKTIVDTIGPRMPCSKTEAKAAEYIKNELEKTCDEVAIEPFKCHPGGFLGWIKIDITLVLGSLLIFIVTPFITSLQFILYYVSVALNIIAWIITWKEFFSYQEFVDRIFKERSSQNVVGRINPSGGATRIIAFSGHHDSAPVYNLLEYLRSPGYAVVIPVGFGILALWTALSILTALLSQFAIDVSWFQSVVVILFIIGIPVFILLWFFTFSSERANKVPGAVDNLSAVAVVLGIGRYLKQHPDLIPAGTEIRLISFGCEEAGLRGAYRYAARHKEELSKVEFELVNMDGIQSAKKFMIMEYEPTTRTAHAHDIAEKIDAAGKKAGINAYRFGVHTLDRIAAFFTGGTDATAFSKAKLKTCSFGSLDVVKYLNNYHTSRDTPDKIDDGAIEVSLAICLTYIDTEAKKTAK
nr:M28 family peptidase [Candidatus Sigynarchaeota archaeon]